MTSHKLPDEGNARVCNCADIEPFHDDYSEGTESCKLCSQRCFCPTCQGCRWCGPQPGSKPASGIDLIAIWKRMGRPEIPLERGVSISDLNLWLQADRRINLPFEHVGAVWSFLMTSLGQAHGREPRKQIIDIGIREWIAKRKTEARKCTRKESISKKY